jgi:Fic family protein
MARIRLPDKYLVKNLMMEEAITSAQLEGASTTRKVAKDMLKNNRKPADKSEQMILNNYFLLKKVMERKDEPLSIPLISELHAIATFNAIDNDAIAGELRHDNDITVSNIYNEIAHQPPCYTSLPTRLGKLCDYDIAYLYTETDDFDLTYFIYHQVDIVAKAVDALRQHIQNKKAELFEFMTWIERSPLSKKLKRVQLEILKEAVKQPGKTFTAKQVAIDFEITENTARTYLNQLVDKTLWLSSKSRKIKTVLYLAPQVLAEQLKI